MKSPQSIPATGLSLFFFLLALASPVAALAQGTADQGNGNSPSINQSQATEVLDEDGAAAANEVPKAWNVGARYQLRVGSGTFVDVAPNSTTNDPFGDGSTSFDRVQNVYGLNAGYRLNEDFSFGASATLTHWLSQGGGLNEVNETRFQDIGLSASWSGIDIKPIGARLSASISGILPTSDLSRAATLYTVISPSLTLSKTLFNRLSLSYSLSGGKGFHSSTSPLANIDRAGTGNVLFRAGGSEDLSGKGLVAIAGRNTEFDVSNTLAAGVVITEDLSFSVSYTNLNFWTYDTDFEDNSELTSPFASDGRGFSQYTFTSVALSYRFLNYFGAQAGLRNFITPKTSDNRSFRFPFWNFQSSAANTSQFFVGLSANY